MLNKFNKNEELLHQALQLKMNVEQVRSNKAKINTPSLRFTRNMFSSKPRYSLNILNLSSARGFIIMLASCESEGM
nr:hypothetical protein Q903MT_gene6388 [Picea sitchensis]